MGFCVSTNLEMKCGEVKLRRLFCLFDNLFTFTVLCEWQVVHSDLNLI